LGHKRGFALRNGNFISFDGPVSSWTEGWGINPQGDIVGYDTDATGHNHGFLLSRRGPQEWSGLSSGHMEARPDKKGESSHQRTDDRDRPSRCADGDEERIFHAAEKVIFENSEEQI